MKRLKTSQRTTQKVKTKQVLKYCKVGAALGGVVFIIFFLYNNLGTSYFNKSKALGASCASGDEVSFGNNSWIGYVYSERDDFSTGNYHGFTIQPDIFDESFCNGDCNFQTDGCDVNGDTFSVKFKMRKNFACGAYKITVGGDDGIRLSLDGGNTYVINQFRDQVYTTYTTTVGLNGEHDLILEYYENRGVNRVSFDYEYIGPNFDGLISGDQYFRLTDNVDPREISNVSDALICGAVANYQWQKSINNVDFEDIVGATFATYDPPPGLTQTTYYHRIASDNATFLTSNSVEITVKEPEGDEETYGVDSWIGYVYDGVNNFETEEYYGYITEPEEFDESFCGNNCDFSINGSDINTETFSVRFRMRKTFSCGVYELAIGGDDGVRLSIDGGATYVIDGYRNQAYSTYNATVPLEGTYDLVLEYFENSGGNRVTFEYALVGSAFAGEIDGDQSICKNDSNGPVELGSVSPALICGSAWNYQWQYSIDNINFSDISGANSATYQPTSGLASSEIYYRRTAAGGGTTVESNVVSVQIVVAQGDQVSYGDQSWICYLYDGVRNFEGEDYKGFDTVDEEFDKDFTGSSATISTNGCEVYTETFSARFKMEKTFPCGNYTFTIGGDDGVRLSIDGGSTYIIDDYSNHGYRVRSSEPMQMDGTYNMVLEYYEDGGGNRVSFSYVENAGCVLPIELVYFKATKQDNGSVLLEWKSATEENNDYYTILRGSTPNKLTEIAQVDGAGNSVDPLKYEYVDYYPLPGRSYYRLKQTDFDGAFEAFDLVTVDNNDPQKSLEILKIVPNPFQQQFNINYVANQGEVILEILSMEGTLVYKETLLANHGQNEHSFDQGHQLPKGIYIVRMQQVGHDPQVVKIMKR